LIRIDSWTRFIRLAWLELCWTAMLSVLWLASATLVSLFSKFTTVANTPTFGLNCHNCWQVTLLNAATWVAWGTTFGYFVALFGCFIASLPQGRRSDHITVDEILDPQGDELGVGMVPTSPSAHPTQQYPPKLFPHPSSPTQGHVLQEYSPQPLEYLSQPQRYSTQPQEYLPQSQGYTSQPQGYLLQPPPQPNPDNPQIIVDDERPVPPQEGTSSQ